MKVYMLKDIEKVGLAGEIRSINRLEQRLNEAATLGFKKAIIPKSNWNDRIKKIDGMNITFVTSAGTDKEAKSLLTELGLPFKKN